MFKKLEITDLKQIETFVGKYEPFSDFNATSLWVYNTADQLEFAFDDDKLLVKMNDYITGDRFLMVLGSNISDWDMDSIFSITINDKINKQLKLIPNINPSEVVHISSKYAILKDRDNFDYIYSIDGLATLCGKRHERLRGMVNQFNRLNPDITTKALDTKADTVKSQIINLTELWLKNKGDKGANVTHEITAIKRMLDYSGVKPLIVLGVYDNDTLIAFGVNEILNDDYAIAHFRKADLKYKGVFQYLENILCKDLHTKNVKFLNYEQDLGIEGLRNAKEAFMPIKFLEKFTITKI